MLRQLGNLWILWVTAIVLACSINGVAQESYKVTDLGVVSDEDNFSCAMDVNSFGWTLSQEGVMNPVSLFSGAVVLPGQSVINIGERKINLGTLGGQNSWMNWGGINDFAQAVGEAETGVLDPDGEDFCGFGTHHICRPYLWQNGSMSALPTLGGNNGSASDINNRGQIAGTAQTAVVDTTCPPSNPLRTVLPVLWEKGGVRALPTVDGDPDGVAFAINDQGHAVGGTGDCAGAIHAVSWENDTAVQLNDLGYGATAQGINHRGQIVGIVDSTDTIFAALWENGELTNLGTLPGDFAAIATGINDRGQVVGSTLDSGFNWVQGFLYRDHEMIDLNTLFPASSNLYARMADKINERGQIVGMATVCGGPHAGDIHAFLATPVNESVGTSVAEVATACSKSNLPATVNKQLLHRFGLGRLAQ